MTHLKYQPLKVDILFVGRAAAAIPLHGRGKRQSKFCAKLDEEVCVAHRPRTGSGVRAKVPL